jgi:hypothetical protein
MFRLTEASGGGSLCSVHLLPDDVKISKMLSDSRFKRSVTINKTLQGVLRTSMLLKHVGMEGRISKRAGGGGKC